jgi:predicted metalloprotease
MRWQQERRSENVEDRRGVSPGGVAIGGGLGTILIVLIAAFLGVDPRGLLQQLQRQPGAVQVQQQGKQAPRDPEAERQADFVKATLAMTEDVWTDLFSRMGKTYEKPHLVLFSGEVNTQGCGLASTAVGPFYCPADHNVYIDLDFYQELERRFKAPGEFAQAYVIAHEIGHHVQNLLGISEEVTRLQQRVGKGERNRLSVMLELQADFLAGVWAHHAEAKKHILEEGDIESGLRAATAIGDDALQKQAQGYVVPDSFTHGTSSQRVKWFRKGLVTGDINQGDTFKAGPDL